MKLVLANPLDPHLEAASIELTQPGCIIGSSSDADLPLSTIPGTSEIGRIQAIIRVRGGLCAIENISLKSTVHINGRPLDLHQTVTLQLEDQLVIGTHVLTLQASTASNADEDAPVQEKNEETVQDIFGSLLGGPGVIPVGSPLPPCADGTQAHILTDTRPTVLNHADPLAEQAQRDDISAVLDDAQTTTHRLSSPFDQER